MSEELKRRLVGAAVLLATFSIIAWWVGSRDEQSSGVEQTNAQIRNYDIRELDRIAAAQQVPEELPVTDPEPIPQVASEPDPVAEPEVKEEATPVAEEVKAPKPAPKPAPRIAETPEPPPKPVAKPADKPAPVNTQKPNALPATDTNGEWIVQVSSVTNKSSAQALADRLKSKGWNSFLTNAVVNEKTYYRVRVGPYTKRESADKAASTLTRELEHTVAVMKQ